MELSESRILLNCHSSEFQSPVLHVSSVTKHGVKPSKPLCCLQTKLFSILIECLKNKHKRIYLVWWYVDLIFKGKIKKVNIAEASFKTSSLIAKTGTSHTASENLVKADAKVMTNLTLTERKRNKLWQDSFLRRPSLWL